MRLLFPGSPGKSQLPPEGAQHLRYFPLVCQTGNDGNQFLETGMPGRAQREYLKIIWYLGGTGLIDQFLLGKAYLGLMMVEALKPNSALPALVDGPPPGGFEGPMELVGAMHKPAHHCFKTPMLSAQDQKLYEDLCAFSRGELASPPKGPMSPWDLRLATQDKFPVLLLSKSLVAAVLDKAKPPELSPDLQDAELDVQVPGLL